MNQCNKSFLVEKTMNKRGSGKGTAASFVFFAARAGIRGSKDKAGCVGMSPVHRLGGLPGQAR